MNKLKYTVLGDVILINIDCIGRTKFSKIRWHTIKIVGIVNHCVTRKIYNFILRLPNLKRLQIVCNSHGRELMTYNTKFFKHKLLLICSGVRLCRHHRSNIIFIL